MKLNKTAYILVAVVIVLLLVLVALAIACVALVSQDISDSSTSVSSGGDSECSPNPCQNGGICIDGVASHNCTCKAGFDGPNCEKNIDECSPNPCQNGGTCIDAVASHNCSCNAGFYGTNCENKNVSNDCSTLRKDGLNTSGIYRIFVQGINGPIRVYCDMVTDDGGWTVIQRRIDGSLDFYLDWNSYKMGFGTLSGEFWLGNDKIHHLTANGNTVLRVELEDWSNNTAYAVFGLFMVDDESKKYKLTVGNYSGTAGDSLKAHNGMFFTTKDRDNDKKLGDSCAVDWRGAWWYHSCYNSNLNGQYLGNTVNHKGIVWYDWKSNYLSLKRSTMMIRRRL